ncbi:MAG: four helix bundle protein [Anaerolineae bacterium]
MTGDERTAALPVLEIETHKDLVVWQKAMDLVVEIYHVTGAFPREELYGLVSQMRRAAVSIPSNIAEGAARPGTAEYQRFAAIALGSAAELETQMLLAQRLAFIRPERSDILLRQLNAIRRMLCALIAQLKRSSRR